LPRLAELLSQVRVVAFPLASRVHGEGYYRPVLERFRRVFRGLGVECGGLMITGLEDVEKVRVEDIDVAVLLFLTGGTSAAARRLVERLAGKPVILIGHLYHNSIASAVSAASKLRARGFRPVLLPYRGGESIIELARVLKVARLVSALSKMKVVHIGGDGGWERFLEVTGARVVTVKPGDVELPEAGVDEQLAARIDLGGVEPGLVAKPYALYRALKKLIEEFDAHGLAIDCFSFLEEKGFTPCLALSLLLDDGYPAACEADYRSLLLLALAQGLTGRPGWIGNIVDTGRGRLMLAHCTVATSLTSYATLLPHFETGKPYAVAGTMKQGEYTIAAIDPEYRVLKAAKAKLKYSGTLTGGRCRTQSVFEADIDFDELVSNHHVAMQGDVRRELRIAAYLLGMRYEEYGAGRG